MKPLRQNHLPPAWKLWLVGLVCGLAVFHASSGPILAPLLNALSAGPPRLMAVILDLNGRRVEIMPNQGVILRPMDHVRVAAYRTNLWSKSGLSLEGIGFDARPLLTGAKTADILPLGRPVAAYEVVINRGIQTLGRFKLIPVMLPVDWVLMAQAAQGQRRFDLLEKAREQVGSNPILLAQLARTARSLGRLDNLAEVERARLNTDFSPARLAGLANLYQSLDRPTDEAWAIRLLSRLSPDDPTWSERLLATAEKTSDESLKVEALTNLAKTAAGPRSAEALKKLGYTYVSQKKFDQAAEAYAEAARLDPTDANIFSNLVAIYDQLNRPQEMRRALEKLIQLRPNDLDTARRLARTAPEDEALKAWDYVLKINPDDLEGLTKSIKILEQDDPSDALARLYARLAVLKADDPVVHYNLGLTLASLDRLAEAEQSLDTAHRLSPNDPAVLSALLEVQLNRKEDGAAAATAQKLVQLQPDKVELYELIYRVLSEEGNRAELTGLLRAGVKANPKEARLWRLLSSNLVAQKELKAGAAALAKAVELEDDNLDDHLRLAKLYLGLKQDRLALAQYQAVLKQQPDHPVAGPAYLKLKLQLLKSK